MFVKNIFLFYDKTMYLIALISVYLKEKSKKTETRNMLIQNSPSSTSALYLKIFYPFVDVVVYVCRRTDVETNPRQLFCCWLWSLLTTFFSLFPFCWCYWLFSISMCIYEFVSCLCPRLLLPLLTPLTYIFIANYTSVFNQTGAFTVNLSKLV